MTDLPLSNRRFLNTRPKHQAGELTFRLRELGAEVVEFPTLEIVPPPAASWERLRKTLDEHEQIDWLMFTSANGVIKLCEGFQAAQIDPERMLKIPVAVIGGQTAAAAREAELNVQFVAEQSYSEGFAKEFLDSVSVGQSSEENPLFILMLRAQSCSGLLPQMLTDAGVQVCDIPIYGTRMPEGLPIAAEEVLESLVEEKENGDNHTSFDMVICTSSLAAKNLARTVEEGIGRGAYMSSSVIERTPMAAIGQKTAKTVEELNWRLEVIPQKPSVDSLVSAIVSYYLR